MTITMTMPMPITQQTAEDTDRRVRRLERARSLADEGRLTLPVLDEREAAQLRARLRDARARH